MRAKIKAIKWAEFINAYQQYGFMKDDIPMKYGGSKTVFVRPASDDPHDVTLLVITMDSELHLTTPMGESPFMETHESAFNDLVEEKLIEYFEGVFD